MTFEELVGQKLVLGVEGTSAAPETIDLFQKTHAGGLILFERNFVSPQRLREFISDLETALGKRLLVMVDHEGGRVVRFKEGVTLFPDAQTMANRGQVEDVRRQGETEAEEIGRASCRERV